MDDIPQQDSQFDNVKQFTCPNCGGQLEVKRQRTQFVGCQYCGTELDVTDETAKALLQQYDPGDFPPLTKIKLGMEAVIDDVRFVVVGRTRYKNKYKEYWQEYDDGELASGYSDEVWEYDEWLMFSEMGHLLYLIEDKEGFYISQEIVPLNPQLPSNEHQRLNFTGGKDKRIQEYGHSHILYHEGESTYQVQIGERIGFAAYKLNKDEMQSVEWRYARHGGYKEIEFFSDIKLKDRTVAQAFGLIGDGEKGASLADKLEDSQNSFDQETVQSKVESGKNRLFAAKFAGAAALICLGFIIFSWFTPKIYQSKTNFNSTAFRMAGLAAGKKADKPFVVSQYPIEVKNEGQLLEVSLNTKLDKGNNQWLYVGTEVLDGDSVPVQTMEGDFWYESGSTYECDEDGCGTYYWEEDETSTSQVFKANEAGTYTVRTWAQMSSLASGSLLVTVKKPSLRDIIGLVWWCSPFCLCSTNFRDKVA